jgi:hypothetical protein
MTQFAPYAGITDIASGSNIIVGIGNVNHFDLASIDSLSNPLPTMLVEFRAYAHNGIVYLKWATGSENNSEFFAVERSADGAQFSSLATIPAANNSGSRLEYGYDDSTGIKGRIYYRLKLTDRDGKFVYYKIVKVETFRNSSPMLAFPNPVTEGQRLSLKAPDLKNKMVTLTVTDITGRRMNLVNTYFDNNGLGYLPINNYLLPGMYIVEASVDGLQYLAKFSVHE